MYSFLLITKSTFTFYCFLIFKYQKLFLYILRIVLFKYRRSTTYDGIVFKNLAQIHHNSECNFPWHTDINEGYIPQPPEFRIFNIFIKSSSIQ